eukprot:TRINITY_DN16887_c0_g1_i1.p1 TRINITY_DN16887_c0_g1~~TRINITY_DN16887_c0_g1_i1.p1  ORF type:complete len:300 (+),score=56.17 TRINITY_DN16887_c0_g1_i1:134-1033(+)
MCIRDRKEGFKAFWYGNGTAIMRLVPYHGIRFSVYEECKLQANQADEKAVPIPSTFLCGAIAGLTATVLTYPMDVIKTRVTLDALDGKPGGLYGSPSNAVRRILREEGWAPLRRGLAVSAIGIVIFDGIQFATYEGLNYSYRSSFVDPLTPKQHATGNLVSGALAGWMARVVAWPFDTLRKRVQMCGAPHAIPGCRHDFQTGGYSRLLRDMIHYEGVGSLWKGKSISFFLVGPSAAITFACYEYIDESLHWADRRSMDIGDVDLRGVYGDTCYEQRVAFKHADPGKREKGPGDRSSSTS